MREVPGRIPGYNNIKRAVRKLKVLCDEITSALDVTTQAQVIRLLMAIREKENVSIILVSHDLALVSTICDRIMVMKDGEVVDQGETGKVIFNSASEYTRRLLESVISV